MGQAGLLIHVQEAPRFRVNDLNRVIRVVDERAEQGQRLLGSLPLEQGGNVIGHAGRPMDEVSIQFDDIDMSEAHDAQHALIEQHRNTDEGLDAQPAQHGIGIFRPGQGVRLYQRLAGSCHDSR